MLHRPSALLRYPAGIQDLLSKLGMFLSVAGLVMSLALGIKPGPPTAPGATPAPGESEGADYTDYEVPDLNRQAELETIRSDINLAIKQLRLNELSPPVIMDPLNLQFEAQRWAEQAAVTGRLADSPQNVTMIQHHLPESGASGYAFLEDWLHSPAHTNVLLDPRYTFYGIGVAVGRGQVWVAVQFSA